MPRTPFHRGKVVLATNIPVLWRTCFGGSNHSVVSFLFYCASEVEGKMSQEDPGVARC